MEISKTGTRVAPSQSHRRRPNYVEGCDHESARDGEIHSGQLLRAAGAYTAGRDDAIWSLVYHLFDDIDVDVDVVAARLT